MYRKYGKYIFDYCLSAILLIVLSPVMILIILILIILDKDSPFFIQDRPGKNGKIFRFIKFRTMSNITSNNGQLLDDKSRITRIGHILRQTSLDELPSLLNVLKGEMSLVGPRPLLVEYLSLYSEDQARRHEVKPGITGWAQINGRNAISWEDKFDLDIWYVDNQSLGLDVKIIFLTIKKVLFQEGINSPTAVTMEKYKGSHN